ncbi:HTH domain-containing protein [Halorubrum sp. SD690R]|uniref:HTH domain-containing protein n=1 Tax=Halorubrum sp. SD690R TaxID=2518117 RepID=UPI001F541540|nr:HTH domain-containing protein [Halorubrum sp. SD690R]
MTVDPRSRAIRSDDHRRQEFSRGPLTANDVTERVNVSRQTADDAIEAVEADGVVVETTGQQRNRAYNAIGVFDILERAPRR